MGSIHMRRLDMDRNNTKNCSLILSISPGINYRNYY